MIKTAIKRLVPKPIRRSLYRSRLMPIHWLPSLRLFRILNFEWGYLKSVAQLSSVDRDGNPIPWYTYPAIEFIRQLDFHDKTVFEYGSGNSTLFWSRLAKTVVTVEDDKAWYAEMLPKLSSNCELLLEADPASYVDAINRFAEPFDVIIVDGLVSSRTRLKCSEAAIKKLRVGGLVILDNSDWLPESSHVLRSSGLLEVDMTGFAPMNPHTCTTSFYFHRQFNFASKNVRQPMPGIGGLDYNWEVGAMHERLLAAADVPISRQGPR